MALLSEDQYKILVEQKEQMECFIKNKYCRNLSKEWLHKAALINMSIYKAPYVDINCPSCIGQLLTKLYNPVVDFENETKRLEAEKMLAEKALQNTVMEVKRKGRTPKNWVKDEKEN